MLPSAQQSSSVLQASTPNTWVVPGGSQHLATWVPSVDGVAPQASPGQQSVADMHWRPARRGGHNHWQVLFMHTSPVQQSTSLVQPPPT